MNSGFYFRGIICFFSVGLFFEGAFGETPFVVLTDNYVQCPYTITLYNINEAIAPYLKNGKNLNRAEGDLLVLSTKYKKEDLRKIEEFNGAYIDFRRDFYSVYGTRISKILAEAKQFEENASLYNVKVKSIERNGYDWGLVPCVYSWKGSKLYDRGCLFDQFSSKVDQFVSQNGFGETIAHKNKETGRTEKQLQISIFGTIEICIDGVKCAYMGFFQYTIGDAGLCYHRTFKPWTESCLRSLSNSDTQRLIRFVMFDVLQTLWTPYSVLCKDAEIAITDYFDRNRSDEKCLNTITTAAQHDTWISYLKNS